MLGKSTVISFEKEGWRGGAGGGVFTAPSLTQRLGSSDKIERNHNKTAVKL